MNKDDLWKCCSGALDKVLSFKKKSRYISNTFDSEETICK